MDNPLVHPSQELIEKYMFRLPQPLSFGDYLWPGMIMSAQKIKEVKEMELGENDVLIASYPKSGTTWMSELLSAISYQGDLDTIKQVKMDERVPWIELEDQHWWIKIFYRWQQALSALVCPSLSAALSVKPLRRVMFTHLPIELLPKAALEGKCKLIYVSRNPKDQAVSFWHFHRMARFLGLQRATTWEEFFPLFCQGNIYCGSWFEHVLGYWRLSQGNSNMLFCKYEEMKMDLGAEVEKIERFVGIHLTPEQREKVLAHCTFDSMKNNKMANRDGVMLLNQKICKFMRKGVVGDWRNHFTLSQSDAFDALYKEKLAGSGLEFSFQ